MTTVAVIPTSISSEALNHIVKLGLQREFEQLLEYTKESVPGLQVIDVSLNSDPDGEDEPRVVIDALVDDSVPGANACVEWNWGGWLVNQFSPDVVRHFVMMTAPGRSDGR